MSYHVKNDGTAVENAYWMITRAPTRVYRIPIIVFYDRDGRLEQYEFGEW